MNKFISCILLVFSVNAFSGIQVDATRVIDNSSRNSASLAISNDSDDTYMVQSWLDTGNASQMPKNLPIIVTPPILKLASKKEAILRFIYSGNGLSKNEESLFWINIQEIPPSPKQENVLQVAIRTRIKLFYRPDSLKINLQQQAKLLKWHHQDDNLLVINEGPLHVTFGKLTLQKGTKSWTVNADMVKPHDILQVSLPHEAYLANNMSFTYINDYGGYTEIKNITLH
ncbi:pili assembly chaperone [Serratia symbiotica str. 'Cinara cedri']|nr:pili assembly chaperone [Serratia symbiotica str. 'Cinara cedri']